MIGNSDLRVLRVFAGIVSTDAGDFALLNSKERLKQHPPIPATPAELSLVDWGCCRRRCRLSGAVS